MKRYLSLLLCALLICGLFTGCSGSANKSDLYYAADEGYANRAPEIAPMETMAASKDGSLTSESGTTSNGGADRKLIKIVNITAESQTYSELLLALDVKVSELGGYIQNREQYNGNRRSSTMTIRIPADKLNLFVEHVSENANVISSSETATDVTLEYVDTEAKVKTLETEQARLLELLAKAESLDDILAIEARLSDVTYELERYASRLKSLENQVSYATVNLTLREVEVLTPKEEPGIGQRITTGFAESVADLWEMLTDFFVWVLVESPNLAFLALVIWLIYKLLRFFIKRGAKFSAPPRKQNPGDPQNPQQPK